jgi:hypothetical protein
LARYRWKPDFLHEYSRFRSHVNRDYGERAYGDKEKIETSGMLKDAEPDYETHVKPYKPEKAEAHVSWESEPQEAIGPKEVEQPEPLDLDQLFEQTESTPMEDKMLEIKSENIWEPLEQLPSDAEPKKKITDAEPRNY